MTEEKIKKLEERIINSITRGEKFNSNMVKKYTTILIREGEEVFEEALKINYRRQQPMESLKHLRNLVNYLRKDLGLKEKNELAYALGITARILKTIAR